MKNTDKIQYISNIRVFATISVILLHIACGYVINDFSAQPNSYWWTGNIYDSCVRCCVPLFVMITGALFLSREIELKTFFKKRLVRILLPFLFWSFVYVVNEVFVTSWKEGGNFFANIEHSNFIARLFKGEISFHFWYIYMLIGLYLFIPIIGKWINNCTEKEILYFLGIWLITTVMSYSFIGKYFNSDLTPQYISGFIGYLILGYYLQNVNKYKIGGGIYIY